MGGRGTWVPGAKSLVGLCPALPSSASLSFSLLHGTLGMMPAATSKAAVRIINASFQEKGLALGQHVQWALREASRYYPHLPDERTHKCEIISPPHRWAFSSLRITPGKEHLPPLQTLGKWLSDVNPGALSALGIQPSAQNHHDYNSYFYLLFIIR